MDTLSSSVSSLKVPNIRRNSAELYHTKNPCTSSSPHFNIPNNHFFPISNKRNSFSHNNKNYIPTTVSSLSSKHPPLKQSCSRHQTAHYKASSGYAAALVDIAKNNNSLETLERDVSRLSKWLRHGHFLEDKAKGYFLKEILSKVKLHKQLVALMKLLVEKNKVGIVDEVLLEFERIYDQLCGTQVVLVSSEMKMEKGKVFGIAKKVRELSGAEKVKVKVRHFVDDKKRSHSFAL